MNDKIFPVAVLRGGKSRQFFELLVEVCGIVEAALCGNLQDIMLFLVGQQQMNGVLDSLCQQIIPW